MPKKAGIAAVPLVLTVKDKNEKHLEKTIKAAKAQGIVEYPLNKIVL